MNIVTEIERWREIRKNIKGTVGFVSTMGCLHEGHASLCRRARKENDFVVASIFVNPTQFNQPSDFEQYQRTLGADCKLLESLGVDAVFCPSKEAMYPDGYEVQVSETHLSREMEGEFRPGHFTGMLTVVLKLLNLAQPTRAYFGEKDFQQLILVKKMVAELFLPVEIVPCPTIREESGLALSSRNARLTAEQRRTAAFLSQLLRSDFGDEAVKLELERRGFRPEYVATQWGRRLAAVWLDKVRLIDNVPLAERKEKNAAVS
ncbi:MAG: pantoate--beta-alanine ligase [Pseudomonadota bacterium]